MMVKDIPEADWKVFREVREAALARFCERTLSRVENLCRERSENPQTRYRNVFRCLQERDKQLARAFDSPRRSQMIFQLSAMYADGLLEPDEFDRFTEETRTRVETLAGASG